MKYLLLPLLLLTACSPVPSGPSPSRRPAKETTRPLKPLPVPLRRIPTREQAVALTFDDGPDPVFTPAILDLLKRNKDHATFFVLGISVKNYPQLLRQAVAQGCEIANHGFPSEPAANIPFPGPPGDRQNRHVNPKSCPDESPLLPSPLRLPAAWGEPLSPKPGGTSHPLERGHPGLEPTRTGPNHPAGGGKPPTRRYHPDA